jgi:hypothetical protein
VGGQNALVYLATEVTKHGIGSLLIAPCPQKVRSNRRHDDSLACKHSCTRASLRLRAFLHEHSTIDQPSNEFPSSPS